MVLGKCCRGSTILDPLARAKGRHWWWLDLAVCMCLAVGASCWWLMILAWIVAEASCKHMGSGGGQGKHQRLGLTAGTVAVVSVYYCDCCFSPWAPPDNGGWCWESGGRHASARLEGLAAGEPKGTGQGQKTGLDPDPQAAMKALAVSANSCVCVVFLWVFASSGSWW